MSDSVRPHRQQPTRLPCPWDSPGKNTGVDFHFLLQCVKVKVKSLSRVRLLATPWTAAYQAPTSMGFSKQEYWSGLPLPSPSYIPTSYIILYSNYVPSCSVVWLFGTPWTAGPQAPLSMEFSKQEYWNGLPFPSPGDLPNPGTEPESPGSPALAGGFSTTAPPEKHSNYNLK